ncbi:hypothetical protein GCM10025878_03590 [Leuconostoc gasicomitatum]|nr:hypothetical protein GCM10025878_03590 [Leuconostoc gasicomitatum]
MSLQRNKKYHVGKPRFSFLCDADITFTNICFAVSAPLGGSELWQFKTQRLLKALGHYPN